MADAHKYLVPEYYSGFSCKGGSCRSTCCHGWGITVSMKEYFELLGLECPDSLRRRLDGALHLVEHPSEERYAQITPNWMGDCPLHLANGLCELHCECGEEALSSVCRYYPRGARSEYRRECSCANSCERVLEMLFELKQPMRFEERELAFELPQVQSDPDCIAVRYYAPVRKVVIGAMQNRQYELSDRFALLGGMTALLSEAFRNRESWIISGALEVCGEMNPPPRAEWNSTCAMNMVYALARMFSRNQSVEEYIDKALNGLGLSTEEEPDEICLEKAAEQYRRARARFDRLFPDWQILFEQMMVNHIFFEGFPFSDRHETLWEAFCSLCAAYGFTRFLAVMTMREREDRDSLIDVCAAVFRLIEHSGFDWNAAAMLGKRGWTTARDTAQLAML